MNTLFGEMKPNTGADGLPLSAEATPVDQDLEKEVADIPYSETDSPADDHSTQTSGEDEEGQKAQEEEVPITDPEGFSYLAVAEELGDVFLPQEGKEYEDSEEGFKELQQDTIKALFEQEYGSPEGEHLAYLAFIKQGGTNKEWLEQTTFSYADVDLEDADTQKELLTRQYQAQGFKADQITKKISRLEASGSLEEEAQEAQEFLLEKEKQEVEAFKAQVLQQEEAQKEAQKNYLVTLQKDIEEVDSLAGIPLNPALKKGLYAHLTKPVGPKGETQYQLNQRDKTKVLSVVLLDFLGLDTEDLSRKQETKKATNLQAALKKANTGSKFGSGQNVQTAIPTNKNRIPTKGMPWGS